MSNILTYSSSYHINIILIVVCITAFPDIKKLVEDLCCWYPSDRPSFKIIVQRLENSDGGITYSLVDRMISRLEAHTQNLEALVDARLILSYFQHSFDKTAKRAIAKWILAIGIDTDKKEHLGESEQGHADI